MTFDPFGDYGENGYLRNTAKLPLGDKLKSFEHRIFLSEMAAAASFLSKAQKPAYSDMLSVHKILFSRVYPWAGQDRSIVCPDKSITKGTVEFANPAEIVAAADDAFQRAEKSMKKNPGKVIGMLAFAHPFLDGNGRTILIVANELAARSSFSIDWMHMRKEDYLHALTAELDDPRDGVLDSYIHGYMRPPLPVQETLAVVAKIRGLGPQPDDI